MTPTEIEAAQPGQEREVLEALWLAFGRKLPERVWNNVHDCWQWEGGKDALRFVAMLDAHSYLDAALMLMAEGDWNIARISEPEVEHQYYAEVTEWHAYAATPALALCAAIAKAGEG